MQHDRAGRAPRPQRGKELTCTLMGTTPITERFLRVHDRIGPLVLPTGVLESKTCPHRRVLSNGLQEFRAPKVTFDVDVHLHHLRGELGIPRSSIAAMAYWKAT